MNNRIHSIDKETEMLQQGLQKAVQKMLQKSAANNEDVVIGDDNGGYKIVPAKDLLNEEKK